MSAPYNYWLVRYVPDVARGERVNVAVIVGRDGGDWAIRVVSDLRRASRIGGDASVLRPWLQRLERSIDDYLSPPLEFFAGEDHPRVTQAWVQLLSHRFNNVLQISRAAPVEAASAIDGIEFLFPMLVATPAPVARSTTRTRLVSNLGDLYERTAGLALGSTLIRRPRTMTGRQRGQFDFAVVDHQVDQLSTAFAFDVRNVDLLEHELQSWNFIVSRLRADGAEIAETLSQTRQIVDPEVVIAVAYQEPTYSADARHHDVFGAALEAWNTLGVRAVPSSELDSIALEARRLVDA